MAVTIKHARTTRPARWSIRSRSCGRSGDNVPVWFVSAFGFRPGSWLAAISAAFSDPAKTSGRAEFAVCPHSIMFQEPCEPLFFDLSLVGDTFSFSSSGFSVFESVGTGLTRGVLPFSALAGNAASGDIRSPTSFCSTAF